jgi:hypothetical protein
MLCIFEHAQELSAEYWVCQETNLYQSVHIMLTLFDRRFLTFTNHPFPEASFVYTAFFSIVGMKIPADFGPDAVYLTACCTIIIPFKKITVFVD